MLSCDRVSCSASLPVLVTVCISSKCFIIVTLSPLDMFYPYMASPPSFDSGSTALSSLGALSKTALIYFQFVGSAPSEMALNLFYGLPFMLLHTKAMLLIRGISFLLDYFALDCFAPSKLMGANGFSSRTRIGYMQYALSNIIMSSAYPFILAAFVLDYMFLMLSRFWLKFFRWGRVDRALSVRQLCRLILILIIFFLPYVFGADEPSSSRLPVFKGTKAALRCG